MTLDRLDGNPAEPSGTGPLDLCRDPMTANRAYFSAVLLHNGTILLVGGDHYDGKGSTTEVYEP